MNNLLTIKNLKTYFSIDNGIVKAVDGVDLNIGKKQTLCLVGESGCGKSVTSLSIMRLIPDPPGRIINGEILFKGQDLLKLSEAKMRSIRGKQISMIFQEPMTSLNPVFTVGNQISEVLMLHENMNRKLALDRSAELLSSVSIPNPRQRLREYPHQLSGGMRQRVMIAMAIACNPELLIADEPTTALDVTIQAQILILLDKLKDDMDLSMLLITHDLGVVAEVADRVMVMYAGKIIESASVKKIFSSPLHPYTKGLLKSVPRIDKTYSRSEKLKTIDGTVPQLTDLPPGCSFADRCPFSADICSRDDRMFFSEPEDDHQVRCTLYQSERQ